MIKVDEIEYMQAECVIAFSALESCTKLKDHNGDEAIKIDEISFGSSKMNALMVMQNGHISPIWYHEDDQCAVVLDEHVKYVDLKVNEMFESRDKIYRMKDTYMHLVVNTTGDVCTHRIDPNEYVKLVKSMKVITV